MIFLSLADKINQTCPLRMHLRDRNSVFEKYR
jgi:hypothetical protein